MTAVCQDQNSVQDEDAETMEHEEEMPCDTEIIGVRKSLGHFDCAKR